MRVSREGNLVTLINVFETKPEQQQELIDQWIRFVEAVTDEPGMIGAALHRSTDGTRVVNYAQWRSEEDFENFVQKYREQMEARRPLAERVDPIFTRSSISLSAEAVDCLSGSRLRERRCVLVFSRAYRADGMMAKVKGAKIVWQSPIESLLSCASTTPRSHRWCAWASRSGGSPCSRFADAKVASPS
jgi:quinol monooxygenase YgiN